jgi:predicted acylesterase/phospholipase RssA/CRP-like cAMP-binding protein
MNSTIDNLPSDLGLHSDRLMTGLNQLFGDLGADTIAALASKTSLLRLRAGETLYRQGEPGEHLHIVLSGRLQVRVSTPESGERIIFHPQPGDAVGEMALFSGARRAATIIALRESALGTISHADINALASQHPAMFASITRMIIERLTNIRKRPLRRPVARTLALLPLHVCQRVSDFPMQLRQALLRYGSVHLLDADSACPRFGKFVGEAYGRYLDDCERSHDFVLLLTDPSPSPWTHLCMAHADGCLLLADASEEPTPGALEDIWHTHHDASGCNDTDTQLVLIHPDGHAPAHTVDWIAPRRLACHHHVREHQPGDVERIARLLSGNAVALVLAGGGARGFAHLGVIRALAETGIPVDAIGGTSFGALAATGLARGLDDVESLAEQQLAFSQEDPLGDYTLPVMSLTRGERLNQVLQHNLPMDIEDLWLPFFAVSSDLTTNETRVHDRGPLWKAIRASVSLPAVLPPAFEDGHLLVDGGVLNNLPVDIMRQRIQGYVIAVDLSVERGMDENIASIKTRADVKPKLLTRLAETFLPGRSNAEIPTMSRIILRITTLASRRETAGMRKLADLCLNPPLGAYDFLDWNRMRDIAEAGYRHAQPKFQAWLEEFPHRQDRAGFVRRWKAQFLT